MAREVLSTGQIATGTQAIYICAASKVIVIHVISRDFKENEKLLQSSNIKIWPIFFFAQANVCILK